MWDVGLDGEDDTVHANEKLSIASAHMETEGGGDQTVTATQPSTISSRVRESKCIEESCDLRPLRA